MKYKIILPEPKTKKTIVTVFVAKMDDPFLVKKLTKYGVFKFEVPGNMPWRYDRGNEEVYFDVWVEYEGRTKKHVLRPVPEKVP